ncbi:sugar transferase [Roseobacter weihaiensis]|uniref:sugar transferase n=1 Tax=Roseobacter weihaiensis TaxID=2763262 RepID=UPI001D0A88D4|nr:sugar transferase [Roseobacter sp. H9]
MPFDTQSFSTQGQPISEREVFFGESSPKQPYFYRNITKRAIDVTLVVLAGLVVLPVLVVLMGLIARDGHSPIYSHQRVGRFGKNFRMYKLRTMVANADDMLAEHLRTNSSARIEWETTQKLKNDPRITPIGRILRKISADELPQLFNVLIGDMSLVGPRPMMASQKNLYSGTSYFELRPGITGLWQVSDRNDCAFSDRVKFDDTYNRIVSFSTDVAVLLRTVKVVMRGTGY